ncbi:MAG: rhomboid family intramembrane serine protease [Verrucomicrobiota bacterium]
MISLAFPNKRPAFPKPGKNFHTLASLLALLLFLPFAVTSIQNGPFSPLYSVFGLTRDGLLNHRNIWQLFTHPLFHGGWIHLLTNIAFIYYFGGRLQHIFGEKEVWRVAIISLLLGSTFHLTLHPSSGPLVGASGIGFGFFFALTTVSPESRLFPFGLRAVNVRNGVALSALLLLLLNPSLGIPGLSSIGTLISKSGGAALFQMGHAYHLGGGIAGWLAVRKYLRKPITLAQLQQQRAASEDDEAA